MSKVLVDAEALHKLLTALNGPEYLIHELRAIRKLQGDKSEINILIDQLNDQVYRNGMRTYESRFHQVEDHLRALSKETGEGENNTQAEAIQVVQLIKFLTSYRDRYVRARMKDGANPVQLGRHNAIVRDRQNQLF